MGWGGGGGERGKKAGRGWSLRISWTVLVSESMTDTISYFPQHAVSQLVIGF